MRKMDKRVGFSELDRSPLCWMYSLHFFLLSPPPRTRDQDYPLLFPLLLVPPWFWPWGLSKIKHRQYGVHSDEKWHPRVWFENLGLALVFLKDCDNFFIRPKGSYLFPAWHWVCSAGFNAFGLETIEIDGWDGDVAKNGHPNQTVCI